MIYRRLKPLTIAALVLVSTFSLTSCDNTSVYGSVGIGVGHGSGSFNRHHGGGRMHGSITVGGRIR